MHNRDLGQDRKVSTFKLIPAHPCWPSKVKSNFHYKFGGRNGDLK